MTSWVFPVIFFFFFATAYGFGKFISQSLADMARLKEEWVLPSWPMFWIPAIRDMSCQESSPWGGSGGTIDAWDKISR